MRMRRHYIQCIEWIEHSNVSKMVSDAELSDDDVIKQSVGTLTNGYSALFIASVT